MQRLLGAIAFLLVGIIVLDRVTRPGDTHNAGVAEVGQPARDTGTVVGPPPSPGAAVTHRPAAGIGNGRSTFLGSVDMDGRPAGDQRPEGSTATDAPTPRDSRLTYVEVADLPAAISPGGGSPVVLVLYGAHCPLSRQLVTGLARLEAQYRRDGVRVLALNVDDDSELRDVPAFLRETGAGFPPARLATWPSGALSKALMAIGSSVIQPHQTFTLPVVAIWNGEGRMVAESQAMPDAGAVGRVIAAMTGR